MKSPRNSLTSVTRIILNMSMDSSYCILITQFLSVIRSPTVPQEKACRYEYGFSDSLPLLAISGKRKKEMRTLLTVVYLCIILATKAFHRGFQEMQQTVVYYY